MAAGIIKTELKGLEGNEAAEPRVFAHDAHLIVFPAATADGFGTVFPDAPNDSIITYQRGACLYVGEGGDVDIELESGKRILFKGVTAGSFLPVLALKVYKYDDNSDVTTTAGNIISLF